MGEPGVVLPPLKCQRLVISHQQRTKLGNHDSGWSKHTHTHTQIHAVDTIYGLSNPPHTACMHMQWRKRNDFTTVLTLRRWQTFPCCRVANDAFVPKKMNTGIFLVSGAWRVPRHVLNTRLSSAKVTDRFRSPVLMLSRFDFLLVYTSCTHTRIHTIVIGLKAKAI